MRKLYEIREDIQAVLNPRISDNDELNDETENPATPEQLRTGLEALELEFDEKLENCLAYIKNLKAEETALAEEIRRLTARKKAAQNKQDSVKEYTLSEIEQAELAGVAVGPHKARIAKSRDAVVVIDDFLIPSNFTKVKVEAKKAEILKWYKETGEILPGIDIETDRVHLRVS